MTEADARKVAAAIKALAVACVKQHESGALGHAKKAETTERTEAALVEILTTIKTPRFHCTEHAPSCKDQEEHVGRMGR